MVDFIEKNEKENDDDDYGRKVKKKILRKGKED